MGMVRELFACCKNDLLILGMEYDETLEFINKNDTLGTYERMKKSGYLRKRLIV